MNNISRKLKKSIIILDGATGTELQKRGMPQGVCPEIWCIKNPEVIKTIHSDYALSGADIIYSCTFGANRIKLGQYGIKNVEKVNRDLVKLAKISSGNALVAGDIGPTGKFIEPFGPLKFEEAVDIFKEQVRGLLKGGVDLFVIETIMDIQEARAALLAVKELSDKFTIVSMTYEKDGKTLNGTDPVTALVTLQNLGADAVGCNCSTGPAQMLEIIKTMKPFARVPIAAKPNAGIPELKNNRTIFNMGPSEFSAFAKDFRNYGANLIGGCCGTTPEHIKQLKKKLAKAKPIISKVSDKTVITSSRGYVVFDKGKISIIGECINPTGKKHLKKDLCRGKTSYAKVLARNQEKQGADVLDVNVQASGVDELNTLAKTVKDISVISSLPISIDTSNLKALEKALRLYPGKALINSVSAEKSKTEKVLKLAKKYGAALILLPMDEKGVPFTFKKRKENVLKVLKLARKLGIGNENFIVDGLALAASSKASSPVESLKTLKYCSSELNINTVLGLSNISFGMPERSWLNAGFFAMAASHGLSSAILDPSDENLMNIKKSAEFLLGMDKDARGYVRHFSSTGRTKVHADRKAPIQEQIYDAILSGDKERIISLIDKSKKQRINADYLMNKVMIPAINKTGELFEKKEYFLPQLVSSAETLKIAFNKLKPYLTKKATSGIKNNIVILATVKGDLHDIGKNIIALLLQNHGFKVIDLGKDVSASKIVKQAKRYKASVAGLSALMTTTMINMKDVVSLAKKEKLNCRFIVGGAAVNKTYAASIGAEYASDGLQAVKAIKKMHR